MINQNITDLFIEGIYTKSQTSISSEEKLQVTKCFIDYISSSFAGSKIAKQKIQRLINNLDSEDKRFAILGFEEKTDMKNAALIQGFCSHIAELDDGERFGMFHPGAPIFSAVLPLMQKYKVESSQFFNSIRIGYEAAIRIARTMQPGLKKRGYHGTGICGLIGAAIACGIILDFSKIQLKNLLSAAATSSSGLLKVIRDDSEMKPYNIGIAAQNAISSVQIVLAGFKGPNDVLGGDKGFLKAFTNSLNMQELIVDENKSSAIFGIYQKPYAACRHCHSPIEAAINITLKNKINIEDIVAVNVKTYLLAIEGHDHVEIDSINSAKMSIPYSVAISLYTCNANLAEFTENYVNNETVKELTKKVKVLEDKEMSALVPYKRAAHVELVMVDGTVFEDRVDYPKGEPETALSIEELQQKFNSLLVFAGVDNSEMKNLYNKILNIGSSKEIAIADLY